MLSKRFFLIALVFCSLAFFSACERKNPVSEYGDSLIDAHKRANIAADEANLAAVKSAIQAYRAANGELPKRLEDAESFIGGNQIDLSKYSYDPQTGSVSPKP